MSKKQILHNPKGMHDILPSDQPIWEKIHRAVKEVADFYNYLKIDTPILENIQLFERPLGETSDVVAKQMFVVKTKGGDQLVLRPEGTASIARAYIQHGLSHVAQPLKLRYTGPMFRYEQPQAGRFRQFYQSGFEIVSNDNDPIYDAQVISACYRTIEELKIKNLRVEINSIGCKNCRPAYKKKLSDYYKNKDKKICKDCRYRLSSNPLRLLDCKDPNCKELKADAPIFLDSLCIPCSRHFKSVLEYLEEIKIPYLLNHHLARGFDYYTKTVFEIFAEGFDFAIAAGGRYDYLIEMLGGRLSPGVGGAIGLDRLVEIIKIANINLGIKLKPKIALIHIGELAKKKSLSLIEMLRGEGIDVFDLLGKESLTGQFRLANKMESKLALIVGQKEAVEESAIIRDMKTGAQETVMSNKLAKAIKKRI
ncbi:MAG: histidine--tRNA ligase [Patescibacteria group bacterium]